MPLYTSTLIHDPVAALTDGRADGAIGAANGAGQADGGGQADGAGCSDEVLPNVSRCGFDVVVRIEREEATSLRKSGGVYFIEEKEEEATIGSNLNRDDGSEDEDVSSIAPVIKGAWQCPSQNRTPDTEIGGGSVDTGDSGDNAVIDKVVETERTRGADAEFHLESRPMPFGSLSPFAGMKRATPSAKPWDRHIHARLDRADAGFA